MDQMANRPLNIRSQEAAEDALRFAADVRARATAQNNPQFLDHGLSWITTYAQALVQMAELADRLEKNGTLSPIDRLTIELIFGEYLQQLKYGIAMSQTEIIRPTDFGIDPAQILNSSASLSFMATGNTPERRKELVIALQGQGAHPGASAGLDDTHEMIRDQFQRFADEKVQPFAHGWHLKDELIPKELISELAGMHVFGLTIPEEFGGAGMGKEAMCVVSEELSRGYIGVGSLGTRTDIASELILNNGTPEQKEKYLPAIARGEIMPTAVFTEPNIGSDLAHLTTRGVATDTGYHIIGNKTWITHASRADMMTLLVRTEAEHDDHRGLTMFLAEKPSGTVENPFPATGMSGGEIGVLGYRGMKEYEIRFDHFEVPQSAVLGGQPGLGFKQLMQTFESARIQTAARAIGVAQAALELALAYASDRQQFGKAIIQFDRVYGKIALMAAEIAIARQLTYFAARQKDRGIRCDLEAGMAKLLAARIAWSCADNAVQIHGGNGFALEYPVSRILCDARILSIFEGAAEIQADVIARRLKDS